MATGTTVLTSFTAKDGESRGFTQRNSGMEQGRIFRDSPCHIQ